MIRDMRTRTDRELELPELDLDVDAIAREETAGGGRGFFGNLLWTIALPFRLAGGAVGLVIVAVVGLARALMIPVRLGVTLTKKVIQWASDLVYGIWRLVLLLVGAVLAAVGLVIKVLNATVGAAIRLVLRLVGGVLRALLWVFTLGKLSGARKAKKDAEDEAEGDAVVEFDS